MAKKKAARRPATALTKRDKELEQQQQIVASMNDELREEYQRGLTLLNGATTELLSVYRQLGELISRVASQPGTYEPASVEKLAIAWNYTPTKLYKARAFFEQYTEDEYAALTQLRTPGGATLTWSHVIPLLSVTDKRRRRALEQLAVRESMSVRELELAVREQTGGATNNQRPGSGRRHVQPKSFTEGVRNFANVAGDLAKRADSVWLPMISQVAALPAEQVNSTTLTNLTALLAQTRDTMGKMQAQEEAARSLEQRVRQILIDRGELTDESTDDDADDASDEDDDDGDD